MTRLFTYTLPYSLTFVSSSDGKREDNKSKCFCTGYSTNPASVPKKSDIGSQNLPQKSGDRLDNSCPRGKDYLSGGKSNRPLCSVSGQTPDISLDANYRETVATTLNRLCQLPAVSGPCKKSTGVLAHTLTRIFRGKPTSTLF